MVTEVKAEATTEGKDPENPPAPPETKPAAVAEPDYKAELAEKERLLGEAQAKAQRLEAQLNGARGTLHQRQDWEAELRRSNAKVDDLRDLVKVFIKAQNEGTPELVNQHLTAMETRSEAERAQEEVKGQLYDHFDDIMSEVARVNNLPTDTEADKREVYRLLQEDPAWKEVNTLVGEGFNKVNPRLVRQALHKARDVGDNLREKAHKTTLEQERMKVKKEAESTIHEQLEKHGIFETPNPKSAGNPSPTLQQLLDVDGDKLPPGERAAHVERLKQAALDSMK